MDSRSKSKRFLGLLIFTSAIALLFGSTIVFSHDDDDDENAETADIDSSTVDMSIQDSIYAIINENYQPVKHIFEYSCFDCHSTEVNYPWYHGIPGIKGMIDDDIEEARSHFDMTDGFPFKSEHSQLDLLQDIKEEIENNDMPLMSYRMMHWGRLIEDDRRDSVFLWIDNSIELLKAIN